MSPLAVSHFYALICDQDNALSVSCMCFGNKLMSRLSLVGPEVSLRHERELRARHSRAYFSNSGLHLPNPIEQHAQAILERTEFGKQTAQRTRYAHIVRHVSDNCEHYKQQMLRAQPCQGPLPPKLYCTHCHNPPPRGLCGICLSVKPRASATPHRPASWALCPRITSPRAAASGLPPPRPRPPPPGRGGSQPPQRLRKIAVGAAAPG